MTNKIQTLLRDSATVHWTALFLLSLTMLCAYVFVDILSPVEGLVQEQRGWDSTASSIMQGPETFLNISAFFLIFVGVVLDKVGVRFTTILSDTVMLAGALIKYYAISNNFAGSALDVWFTDSFNHIPVFEQLGVSPFYQGVSASTKIVACSFMIFDCGVEMIGVITSRGIIRWFKGREVTLAMGSEMVLARLGVATCVTFLPFFAKLGGDINVSRPVAFGVVPIYIALVMFIVCFFMGRKLDSWTDETEKKDDPLKISDLGKILSSMGFWFAALLCVLYYLAIFPLQKYTINTLQCNLIFHELPAGSSWVSSNMTVTQYVVMSVVAIAVFTFSFVKDKASKDFMLFSSVLNLIVYCYVGYMCQSTEPIFAVLSLLAVDIVPILGSCVDHKGKVASMPVLDSLPLIICHLTFIFVLPQFKSNQVGGAIVTYVAILVLGASFLLVPTSLWPSVPKLVGAKIIDSVCAPIFWIQNTGLWLFPLLIDKIFDKANVDVTDPTQLSHTAPLVVLTSLGMIILTVGLILKVVDRRRNLGLEEPSIKE